MGYVALIYSSIITCIFYFFITGNETKIERMEERIKKLEKQNEEIEDG